MPVAYPDSIALFLLFSRFEYALKRSGFVQPKGEKKKNRLPFAEAAWFRFSELLGTPFFDSHRDGDAAREIFLKAPRRGVAKQIDGSDPPAFEFDWQDAAQPTNAWDLIEAVKRIRNNLFHGDKFNPDHPRNHLLIAAALTILQDALQRARGIQELSEFVERFDNAPPI